MGQEVSMSSVFTKIINGELPGHFVWEDDICVSFLSINPISNGHALVVPKSEVDHWLDLPAHVNSHLIKVGQIIGQAQMAVFRPLRIGMIIAGLEVPHTHLHIIPMDGMQDLDFSRAAETVRQSSLAAFAEDLKNAVQANGNITGI